jgi:hypothetical protein
MACSGRLQNACGYYLRRNPMPNRFSWSILALCSALLPGVRAAPPPLLMKALNQWVAAREDFSFTQQTRFFDDDGKVEKERVERFDPSMPDSQRWRLIEVDGQPATDEQRKRWETSKNRGTRKRVSKSPGEYLDLDNARVLEDTPKSTRFEIGLRPETMRLLAVENIVVLITVDKETGSIARIGATLRQPISVLLGLARITDLDIDVHIEPADKDPAMRPGDVQTGSTARVTMSRLGTFMEYNWSDFKRVSASGKPKQFS